MRPPWIAFLSLAPVVLAAACGGPSTCGATPSGGAGVTGTVAGAPAPATWSMFQFGHHGDCGASSITIEARAGGVLTLCLPDPANVPDGQAIPLFGDPRLTQVTAAGQATLAAGDAGPGGPCTFTTAGASESGATATVTFTALCGGSSSLILARFTGQIAVVCSGTTGRALPLVLSGTADVSPGP